MESLLVIGSFPKPTTMPSFPFAVAGGRVKCFQSCNSHHSMKKFQLQRTYADGRRFSLYNIRSTRYQTNAGSMDLPKSTDNVHQASPVESLQRACVALYKFLRPYAALGTVLGTISYSCFAAERLTDFTPMFIMKTLEALVAAMFMHLYIGGINQITDIEIDKVNKPHLPLASGELSYGAGVTIVSLSALSSFLLAWRTGSWPLFWAVGLWFVFGTAYSAHFPLLRWKKYPPMAAFYLVIERAIAPVAYYLHAQTYIIGRAAVVSRRSIFALSMLICFSLVIAFFKDIPDIEGDMKHGMKSLAAWIGAERVFWGCIWFLEMAFGAAILMGASSSIIWSKYVTVFGHSLLALILWIYAKSVDLNSKEAILECYTFIWKILYAEYFLLPLVR